MLRKTVVAGIMLLTVSLARAGEPVGVVCNVKVLSDKVEDTSSIEALIKSVCKDSMTDDQKVKALFDVTVKFRHHDISPKEFSIQNAEWPADPVKLFNVYGYAAGNLTHPCFAQLVRAAGFPVRGQSLYRWGGTEVFYDNAWHYWDPALIAYFPKADGKIASVEELVAACKEWYAANPGIAGDPDMVGKIKKVLAEKGVKAGPEILTRCPTMDERGNFSLNYFGWYTAMLVFSGESKTPFVYEEGAQQGHRINIQLHKGEKLTRNWGNKGLDLTKIATNRAPESLAAKVGTGSFYYTPKWGDLANGRVGNGVLEWDVPLADCARVAVLADNLECAGKAAPALQAKDPAKEGVLVLRRPCGYAYITGELTLDAKVGDGGEIAVACSVNNGLDWSEIAKLSASEKKVVDLTPKIQRFYDYWLKFTLKGKGTGVESLRIVNDIQHSQRALPALDKGENTITFSAGPQESTISILGVSGKQKGKHPTFADYRGTVKNINKDGAEGVWVVQAGGAPAEVTYPIETPGDLTRLRFGCYYRANDKDDGWDLQVSLDDGKTFKMLARAGGPCRFNSKYVTFSEIPAGTRKAQVRFLGTQKNVTIMFEHRVDADFKEMHGGFAPVAVTYTWEEKGQPKQDVHVVKSPEEAWKINCQEKPVMKSITLELAQ
jgi:hypothetical protein